MKKLFTLMLALVLSATAFVGCGKSKDDSDEVDMTKFPYYVELDQATYQFGEDEMVQPYFKGNVIYNESVMLVDDGQTISGKLQYKPLKILSVRDYTWKKEFAPTEYTVKDNTISLVEGGTLPYLTTNNLKGQDIPAPYREVTGISNVLTDWMRMGSTIYTESPLLYGNQVHVSYVYDVKDLIATDFADYATSGMPNLKAKLAAGEDVNIVVTGDSVAEGCSSSKKFNREPFMDNWATLFTNALDKHYAGEVTLSNQAKGGMTSDWGAESVQVNKIIAANPDAVFIHFGINDCGAKKTAVAFRDNIQQIALEIQAKLPNCEVVIIKAFTPEQFSYDLELFKNYWRKIDELALDTANLYTIDMYTLSENMLKVKKYFDVTGNGINHLNDYTARIYAMNLLSALIDY